MILRKTTDKNMKDGIITETTAYELIHDNDHTRMNLTYQDLKDLNKLTWEMIRPDQPPLRDYHRNEPTLNTTTLAKGLVVDIGNVKVETPKTLPSWDDYAERIIHGTTPKEVIESIAKDRNIQISSASSAFYRNVNPLIDVKREDQTTTIKASEDTVSLTMGKMRMEQIEKGVSFRKLTIREEIEKLPDFSTSHQFNDHCLANEIGNELSFRDLKKIYLETHPNIKW